MDNLKNQKQIIIRPLQKWFYLDWRGVFDYRDLLLVMVRRDFTAKYKQTVLGPIWFLVNPLITTLVFTVLFNRVLRVPTDGVPPMLFYLCGMLGWGYFSTVLIGTSNSLAGNASLFSKVYFPRLIPPLVVTISSLLAMGIQLVTFLAFYFQHQARGALPPIPAPSFSWLLFPLIVIHMALLALGVGLILSSLTAKYRDLQQLQAFLIQIWMYGTPVIYPLSKIPESYRWIVNLNPMTAIVEGTRRLFLGVGVLDPVGYGISLIITISLFLFGVILYQRSARTFVDTV